MFNSGGRERQVPATTGRLKGFGQRLQISCILTKEAEDMTEQIFHKDPKILNGTAVFCGTRVPIRILFEHLEAGDSLEVFLEDFPSVSCEQATRLLEHALH